VGQYPFFYFYDLEFDASKILDFINTIPDEEWVGPHIGNYDPDIDTTEHLADNNLWTANNLQTDFTKCNEINKIAKYFSPGRRFFKGMMIKKSKKDFKSPFHPLMQNLEFDKKNNIVRTFDIIVPIQGGFVESPLEAIDTKTNEHFTLVPKGLAFMVPNDPSWHFSWCETIHDFRYTLHLRGVMPIKHEFMKGYYHKNV
tara:strand:- start:942 stop:1538 length:597 start_codon:yes stop_codon:yes gene_type:complete